MGYSAFYFPLDHWAHSCGILRMIVWLYLRLVVSFLSFFASFFFFFCYYTLTEMFERNQKKNTIKREKSSKYFISLQKQMILKGMDTFSGGAGVGGWGSLKRFYLPSEKRSTLKGQLKRSLLKKERMCFPWDQVLFFQSSITKLQIKKGCLNIFSHFSIETHVLVLIRSASPMRF